VFAGVTLMSAPLYLLRTAQASQVANVLDAAAEAELEPLVFSREADGRCVLEAPIRSPRGTGGPQTWEVQTEYVVAEFAPGETERTVRIEYEAATDFNDFSQDVIVPAGGDERLHYFFPVYQSLYHSVAGEPNPSPGFDGRWGKSVFKGLRLQPGDEGALLAMYRVADLEPFPLLYNFGMTESSDEFQYHQTIRMRSEL